MSFMNEVAENKPDKPDKYESLLQSRILSKKLKLKLTQYNSIQDKYDTLIREQTINRKPATGGWKRINGDLKQVSASGKNWIWGVNSNDEIYTCKKPCDDSNWINIPGKLKQIEGGESEVWGVNSDNNIYKMNQDHSGGWRRVSGKLANISQSSRWIWGVNDEHKVYRCKQPCNGDWILTSQPRENIGWNPLGNWKDNGKRMLQTFKGIFTKTGCNKECQGSSHYSLQNGNGRAGQCFCGSDWSRITSLGTCDYDNKTTGGAWCNTVYKTSDESNYITIHVGKSRKKHKTITLPHHHMKVNHLALNKQKTNWGDRFKTKVNGNKLTVTRVDSNGGWGQDLKLAGIVEQDKSMVGPSIVQLSCSDIFVYAVDKENKAWFRPIDGTGKWERFGNSKSKMIWINASNNDKVYGIGDDKKIYNTDIHGNSSWNRAESEMTNTKTISGEPGDVKYYITNINGQIYMHSPETVGGSWKNINNENYGQGSIELKQSNNDWKYLGQTDNIEECKIKAVEDIEHEYSSIVYTSGDTGNDVSNKTCYGGVKGGNTNPTYVKGVTTSLAPNGTSRLGGDEGANMLKTMKQLQDEIEVLVNQQKSEYTTLEKSAKRINSNRSNKNTEMEEVITKLKRNRIEINRLLNGGSVEENAKHRQVSNYVIYLLWIFAVIVSIVLAVRLYSSDSDNISSFTYLFVIGWILLLVSNYHRQFKYYGEESWEYISDTVVDNI